MNSEALVGSEELHSRAVVACIDSEELHRFRRAACIDSASAGVFAVAAAVANTNADRDIGSPRKHASVSTIGPMRRWLNGHCHSNTEYVR